MITAASGAREQQAQTSKAEPPDLAHCIGQTQSQPSKAAENKPKVSSRIYFLCPSPSFSSAVSLSTTLQWQSWTGNAAVKRLPQLSYCLSL